MVYPEQVQLVPQHPEAKDDYYNKSWVFFLTHDSQFFYMPLDQGLLLIIEFK